MTTSLLLAIGFLLLAAGVCAEVHHRTPQSMAMLATGAILAGIAAERHFSVTDVALGFLLAALVVGTVAGINHYFLKGISEH